MCGIAGYVGSEPAAPIVMELLRRLEYRGYDSTGLAVIQPEGALRIDKKVGRLQRLADHLGADLPEGNIGIGHTRWATHGSPSDANAHPHQDCSGEIAVIHNGIVENYLDLKAGLVAAGHVFTSETDTEVVPHLVESLLQEGHDLTTAVRLTLRQLQGAQACLIFRLSEPDRIIAARLGNAGGIVIGYGENGMYLASDLPAILPYTRQIAYLEPRELAIVRASDVTYMDLDGNESTRGSQASEYDGMATAKGEYDHFMLKEIHEQPKVLTRSLSNRLSLTPVSVSVEGVPFSHQELAALRRVALVGCGTSWHAALVGRLYLESLAGLQVEVDIASEFRYRDVALDSDTLLVAVTQSGETVDTLAAMEMAQKEGVKQIVLCNVLGSQATRLADGFLDLRAGPEVGVASTKTFTASVASLFYLAVAIGSANGRLSSQETRRHLVALEHVPVLVEEALGRDHECQEIALQYFDRPSYFYMGRWLSFPVALEGALKLKEISYIHAEGYPGGETKHGPIALIEPGMPIVVVAPQDKVHGKMLSNVEEVRARGGVVIAVGTEGDKELEGRASHFIAVPQTDPFLSPLLTVIPLQLFAYHAALRRGCEIDQPRNLAKTVTVE